MIAPSWDASVTIGKSSPSASGKVGKRSIASPSKYQVIHVSSIMQPYVWNVPGVVAPPSKSVGELKGATVTSWMFEGERALPGTPPDFGWLPILGR